MYELLKLTFDICLFKKGPEDIPYSNALFRLFLWLYLGVSYLILFLDNDAIGAAIQTLTGVALILLATRVILYFARRPERFIQTASALLATDALISFFAIPAMATLVLEGTALAFFAVVLLMLWHWTITGHIFSHALEQPFTFGLGIAFLYILVSYQIMAMLFPEIAVTK